MRHTYYSYYKLLAWIAIGPTDRERLCVPCHLEMENSKEKLTGTEF